MDMRLRIPELFAEKGVSPYRVSVESGNRISLSTVYRLKRRNGRIETYKNDMLEALCDVLGVSPGELFERDKPKRSR
jgi:DNA-binding Xre family transcriptional regulator